MWTGELGVTYSCIFCHGHVWGRNLSLGPSVSHDLQWRGFNSRCGKFWSKFESNSCMFILKVWWNKRPASPVRLHCMDGCTVPWSKIFKMFFCFTIFPPCTLLTKTAMNRDFGIIQLIPPITWNLQVRLHQYAGCTGSNKMDQRCAFTYSFTKTSCSCLHCHSLKEDNA